MVWSGCRMTVMDLRNLERQLKSLANGNRLRILSALKRKHSMTVSDIASHLKITMAAPSRLLHILEQAELHLPPKRGPFVTYRLLLTGEPWTRAVLSSLSS